MSEKLVEVIRGGLTESIHRGDIAVVNTKGSVLYALGNTERLTFMRSSSKPLQAVAMLEAGIAEKYNLDLKEIAILLSSHGGEKQHIEVLEIVMRKLGITEDDLKCGVHDPLNEAAAKELASGGMKPRKLHCTCSGKHLGQIAASLAKGLSIEDYYMQGHGIQVEIENILSRLSGVETESIVKGLDGCGVPVYAIPLRNMALAYANLCCEDFMNGIYKKSQNYILSAMSMYPEMVAGTDRLDTTLMKNFGDRLICKFGDEGVYCAGLLNKGIGIAFKIEDGNGRAVGPVIIEILLQMKIIRSDETEPLKEFRNPTILNHKEEKVGEIRAAFNIL